MIKNNWDLPQEIIIQDFEIEINRKENLGMEIPDVPTYQIRFALEEGAWIVLLREYVPKLIKEEFGRLLSINDSIWVTAKGQLEDYTYYILELSQIRDAFISTLVNFWLEDHEFANSIDVAPRIVAAIFHTTRDRGKMLYEGSIRLFKSKLPDLKKIYTIKSETSWNQNARNILISFNEQIENDKHQIDFVNFISTLSILQYQIIRNKQSITFISDDNPSDIIEEIGWNELKGDDRQSVELFSERILEKLFSRPEEDPIEAAENLLSLIFEGINIKENVRRSILDEIEKNIEIQTSNVKTEIDRLSKIVEVLEDTLPLLLVAIKTDTKIFQKPEEKSVDQLEIWDTFEANLQRAMRIGDPIYSKPIVERAIESVYNLLISKSYSPLNATEIISDVLVDRFSKFQTEIDEFKKNLNNFIEENDPKDGSLAALDLAIIQYLTTKVIDLILMK